MTNNDYLKWKALIFKVAKKYEGVDKLLEIDDLVQIGSIGLAKGLETYDPNSDTQLKTWLYNNIDWTIYRELQKSHSINTFISLNTPVDYDEDATIEDILEDVKVNIENEVMDKLILGCYYDEIYNKLDETKANVMIYKYFEGYDNGTIAEMLNTSASNVSGIVREARMNLVRKSMLFRNEYRRIHEISDFNTERMALLEA